MHYLLALILLILSALNGICQETSWHFEFHGGIPLNLNMPLSIHQNNEPTIKLSARYDSKPLTPPILWVWRIAKWNGDKAWELEAVHHKIYLKNRAPEIQEFSVSHGYNVVTINKAKNIVLLNNFKTQLRYGAGIVLAHPETVIRNQGFSQNNGLFELGYYITGPALNFAIGQRFHIAKFLYINCEVKANPSFSKIPIANGHALVWYVPITFISGFGIRI